MTSIHWFRRDLRLDDNPALLDAVRSAERTSGGVVGLFVLDDALWNGSGGPRLRYLERSLAALSEQMDGRLVIRRGKPADVLPAVAREVSATTVHVAESFEPYGRRRDAETAQALGRIDVELRTTGSPYAISPGRVLSRSGGPYRVFTPFRTAWLDHGWRAPAGPADDVPWLDLPSDELPGLTGSADDPELPEAGEAAARARWSAYLEDVSGYTDDRNRPDLDATSRMSIALKWGEVHPRTLLADLRSVPGSGSETFRSELAWREFHADVLFHTPTASTTSLRPVIPDDAWAPAAQADPAFDAWASGRTGYPFVDAGMRQLLAEGWMHGRTRMAVASFLVKDLHIPWQRGAAHFMDRLYDADLAQNQLNWQWVAGTGLDASPYFRIFNPITQGKKFDPDGVYVRRWVPELRDVPGSAVHEPWKLAQSPAGYPGRMVDHAVERRESLDAYERARRS